MLPDENLGLYSDSEATNPVTSLNFLVTNFQPPLGPDIQQESIYIRNEAGIDLIFVEPCASVFDTTSEVRIGTLRGTIYNLDGGFRGGVCDDSPVLLAGEIVEASVDLALDEPGLGSGEYTFIAVFAAVGEGESPPPTAGEIHGTKFHDLNGDGTWNESEPGLPDFTIVLDIGDDGTGDISTTTNSTGDYWFMDVPFGLFRVWESPPAGWMHTHPVSGFYTGDLASGDIITGLNFGNVQVAKIAFTSNRTGAEEIHHMSADGIGQTLVTSINGVSRYPSWSPDRSKITFAANWDIYTVNANGTELAQLMDTPDDIDTTPSWSPDGARIAFASRTPAQGAVFDIYVMNADGSNVTRLTAVTCSNCHDQNPAWSPDGAKIAFQSIRGRYGKGIGRYTL